MVVQKTLWLIPLMQTIHILCVALVFSSVAMIEFRVLGYSKANQSPLLKLLLSRLDELVARVSKR